MKSSDTIIDMYNDVTKEEVILLGKMLDETLKNDVYLPYAKQCAKREETGIVALHDFIGMCTGEEFFLLPLNMMPLFINETGLRTLNHIKLSKGYMTYNSTLREPVIARWRLKVGM